MIVASLWQTVMKGFRKMGMHDWQAEDVPSVHKINNLFINAQGLELIYFSFSFKKNKNNNQSTLAWHIGKKLWLWILQNVSGIPRGVFVKLYCLSDFGRSKVK